MSSKNTSSENADDRDIVTSYICTVHQLQAATCFWVHKLPILKKRFSSPDMSCPINGCLSVIVFHIKSKYKHWTEKHLCYQYSAEKSLAVKIQNNGSYLIYLIHVYALYRRKLTFFLKSEIKLYFYDLRQKLVFLSWKIA